MHITESEVPVKVVAKTCGCKEKSNNAGRKVTYSFVVDYHNLCIDKKDIISAELEGKVYGLILSSFLRTKN
jgi:hypothetical protein